eukprot:SAG22_NODE_480_length_9955_cov_3.601258_2_plen_234_part_00
MSVRAQSPRRNRKKTCSGGGIRRPAPPPASLGPTTTTAARTGKTETCCSHGRLQPTGQEPLASTLVPAALSHGGHGNQNVTGARMPRGPAAKAAKAQAKAAGKARPAALGGAGKKRREAKRTEKAKLLAGVGGAIGKGKVEYMSRDAARRLKLAKLAAAEVLSVGGTAAQAAAAAQAFGSDPAGSSSDEEAEAEEEEEEEEEELGEPEAEILMAAPGAVTEDVMDGMAKMQMQ